MTNGLEPYPVYKNVGLPWLPQIPEHWQLHRGKTLFQCIDIRSSTGKEELLTVSSARGVVPRSSATVTMFKAESYIGYKLCWPGDLVINSLWAWGRGLGVSRNHGIISSAYGVYRLREGFIDYAPYIHELVRSSPFNWELQVRSQGIWISRLQLTDDAFLAAPFPVPPIAELCSIVRFLDNADRQINRYIRSKKNLIALLNEQKHAIIHRAVTQGLDRNVKMKPSGVEWLGDVPEHWEVVPLRWYLGVGSGDFLDGGKVASQADSVHAIPVIGGNGIAGYCTQSNSNGPTIVIGRVGALCGNVHVIEQSCWITDNALRVTKLKGFEADFLALTLRAMNLNRLANTSAQPLITGGMLKSQHAPRPSAAEQHAIVKRVKQTVVEFDRVIRAAEEELRLIHEYRTRLVADVVTGKLDVREASANLPEVTDQSVILDEADDLLQDESTAEEGKAEAEDAAA